MPAALMHPAGGAPSDNVRAACAQARPLPVPAGNCSPAAARSLLLGGRRGSNSPNQVHPLLSLPLIYDHTGASGPGGSGHFETCLRRSSYAIHGHDAIDQEAPTDCAGSWRPWRSRTR